MVNRDRLVTEFLNLVKIEGLSKQEGKVAQYLSNVLEGMGIEYYIDQAGEKIGGETGNLIAEIPATDPKYPALLFSSHMDTVGPVKGIKPVVDGDAIRSDGTTVLGADDKSGIAAIIECLRIFAENKIPHGHIDIVFDIAEEIGLLGAKNLDFSRVTAKMAYILDNSDVNKATNRAPTANRMVYEVRGVERHAGMEPEKGISAIEVASHAIAAMKLGRIDHETTANIGTIEGGTATNIVANYVKITAEARSHDEAKLKAQSDLMKKAFLDQIGKFTKVVDGKKISPSFMEDRHQDFAIMNVPESAPTFQLAKRAGQRIGIELTPKTAGGGTDGNVYNLHGIESVVIGTGMTNVHTVNECIKIQDMVDCTRLLIAIIEESVNYGSK
jgi:tripeptide aminopeptidase